MPPHPATPSRRSAAVLGSGGSGAVTTGLILLAALGKAGYYGLMTRSSGPQIRGGESMAMIRLAARPVDCLGDRLDLLAGLDWRDADRFADELPLDADSLVLADTDGGPVPAALAGRGPRVLCLPLQGIARSVPEGRPSMVALGALGALLDLPLDALESATRERLAHKGGRTLESALACLGAGHGIGRAAEGSDAVETPPHRRACDLWNLSGNEAAGLGALRGGVRFVAAYPITPASEMLEWLAPRLELVGGSLLQAEDELASINMILGASFGGVPALTATSGPGLSLMTEGIGLAVASETPVVVVDVQRGGPSTGIPSKSEQSDLDIALHGLHGDAPHLVLAPLSVPDCAFAVDWAVRLAERLQTAAIVLSDQQLGQSRAICDPPPAFRGDLKRHIETVPGPDYCRYAPSPDGVSPMTLPGTPGGAYTADGLEHNGRGTPSSRAQDHADQMRKRRDKIAGFDFGDRWGEVRGTGPLVLLAWGSTAGAVFEAAERLTDAGHPARAVALRLIAPLPRESLAQAIAEAERLVTVELNASGQLFRYLHGERALPHHAESLARPGPLPWRPGEIVRFVLDGD